TQRDAKRLIRIAHAIQRRSHVLRTRGPASRRRLRGSDLRKKQERRHDEREDRERLSHIAPPHTCRRASTTGIRAARFANVSPATCSHQPARSSNGLLLCGGGPCISKWVSVSLVGSHGVHRGDALVLPLPDGPTITEKRRRGILNVTPFTAG